MKLWTDNFTGNLHEVAAYINTAHLELVDGLVCLERAGAHTIAVFRVSDEAYAALVAAEQAKIASQGVTTETVILSGGADGVRFSQRGGTDGAA